VEPEVEENIYENPTFENGGMYIYSGVGIFIVILIILLLSLLMYYRNKGGVFGAVEKRLERRRRLAEEKRIAEEGRVNQVGGSGLTVGQEEFYQDLYGVHPTDIQQMQHMQQINGTDLGGGNTPINGSGPQPMPMPFPPNPNHPFPPPPGMAPGPFGRAGTVQDTDGQSSNKGNMSNNILTGPEAQKEQPQISRPEDLPKLPPAKVDEGEK
jgi:hypothetical protein